MKKYFVALLVFALTGLSGGLFAQTYTVDVENSKLAWEGAKVTGKHHGVINIQSGQLTRDGETLSGEFAIDMNSIVDFDLEDPQWNQKLVGHLKSDDFFAVDKHPVSIFKITNVAEYEAKEDEKATHTITGDLTIKGITHQISFPAYVNFSEGGMTAEANFAIDRTKWDIRFRSGKFFMDLGDKLIYDDIKFELNLKAIEAES